MFLASLILLLCAAGSCYLGEHQRENEERRLGESSEAMRFTYSHVRPNTNVWDITSSILFFAGTSVAFAALMLGRQKTLSLDCRQFSIHESSSAQSRERLTHQHVEASERADNDHERDGR